ncbi:hypothetical protein GCM10017673_39320 [Streptosporangium violaceochromogenes]|nr:hypothetical protein GCM10017673_39320 [Streptosporangium violaceochromogenes]
MPGSSAGGLGGTVSPLAIRAASARPRRNMDEAERVVAVATGELEDIPDLARRLLKLREQ